MSWLVVAAALAACVTVVASRPLARRRPPPPSQQKRRAPPPIEVARLTQPLVELGFESAGTFIIPFMPWRRLRLLVKQHEAVQAIVVEDARTGVWLQLISDYVDGSSITFSNSPRDEPAPSATQRVVRFPGWGAERLYRRLLDDRPRALLSPASAAEAPVRVMARRERNSPA